MKNRLGIYFFYDKDGVVDDYVTYYLQHIRPFCKELCVVVNEPLNNDGYRKLEQACDKLIIRENVGFDSQAYKHAMESYGYDELKKYDELLLCNFTCYGPVFPFEEMFEKMDKRDCDFWGMSYYPRVENAKVCELQETNYIPEHIMSFFMIIRNRMLSSDSFKYYWDTIKIPQNYAEAVLFNELRFTDYFTNKGFQADTFIPKEVTNKFSENIFAFAPIYTLECRSPLVKRNAFKASPLLYQMFGLGNQSSETLKYIEKNTNYDVNMIWDDLLRTQKGSLVKRNLHLNYFLDENSYTKNETELKEKQKVAMMCYCYYPDMLEYCCNYAKNLPEWADIYLFLVDENLVARAKEVFSILPNKLEIRVKENRGQLASMVLISGKDIFDKYDLVCVTQAKKSSQLPDVFSSENFCNHCWNGVLKTKSYVLNLIQTFNDNPRLGYSCNFIPHWGVFKNLVTNETYNNKENMLKIMEQFDLKVPFDDEPIASYGECYWVRSKGFKKLLAHEWQHTDFPEASKTPKDGCILNALERLMPIFVQDQGFYPAWIIPNTDASLFFDNIYFNYRELTKEKQLMIKEQSLKKESYLKMPSRKIFKHFIYKFLSTITFGKSKQKLKQKSKKYNYYIKIS